nr:hypothetical protein AUSP0071_00051 [uncultured phage]
MFKYPIYMYYMCFIYFFYKSANAPKKGRIGTSNPHLR